MTEGEGLAARRRAQGEEVASAVDAARLLSLVDEVSSQGALPDKGVERLALTESDLAARRLLVDLARSLGATPFRDAAGNFFFRWRGQADLKPVVIGSHLDTQPQAGPLDGALGVCSGIETMRALTTTGIQTRRPIEVAIWTNEEGCRFAPGTMGSAAFADPGLLESFKASRDEHGVSFGEALGTLDSSFHDVPLRELCRPLSAFLEVHVEGGSVLDVNAGQLGVVDRVQGARWFQARIIGQSAHPGTTPLSRKHDALMAAVEVASRLYELLRDGDEHLRLTIGRMRVEPGSINVIPGKVELSIDLRHPDSAVLDSVEALISAMAGPVVGCDVTLERTMLAEPVEFDNRIVDLLERNSQRLGLPCRTLASGSFHDAVRLARLCPTGMIFVPSIGGLSHNPEEWTPPRDMAAATRLLALTAVELADQDGN